MAKYPTLIADIGGTNARFALSQSAPPFFFKARTLQCGEFEDIYQALDLYLQTEKIEQLSGICFAVAGPVVRQTVTFPNSHWHIDAPNLAQRYDCHQTHILNDFEAIALSLASLTDDDLLGLDTQNQVNLRNKVDDFTIGVIGPGSGLGIAGLCRRNGVTFPLVTEAGHVGFAPESVLQNQVLNYLHKEFDNRISRERLLSGPGLVNIYNALCEIHAHQNSQLTAADIAIGGTKKTDKICQQAIDLFFEILGQIAGDVVLSLGALDGIYIAGGIAQRYPTELKNSSFRAGFENKGRHRSMLEKTPSWLITHNNPGLVGASIYAQEKIKL